MSKFTIFSVKKEHYNPLAIFLSNFEKNISTKKEQSNVFWYSRFSLWWDNNPAFSENFIRGLILECGDKIEGFIGFIPSFFQLSGEQIIVFNGTTWRVNKKFRGIPSLKLLLKLIDYSKESIYFNAINLENIAVMHQQLGFKPIFAEKRLTTYCLIINPFKILIQQFPGLSFLRFFLQLFHPLIAIYHLMINFIINTVHNDYETRIIKKADKSFDELWAAHKTKFNNTNVRTSKVINWYCSNNGVVKNILFGCYMNNKLLGYMLCMSEVDIKTRKKLTVIDLWGQLDDDQVVFSLSKRCIQYGIEGEYDLVLFPAFHNTLRAFSRKFLYKILSPNFIFKANGRVLINLTEESSYFTYLQADEGLF